MVWCVFWFARAIFSLTANLKACAGFRLINNQSHSGEWSRDVGDSDRQDRGRLRLAHLPAVAPTPEAPPSPQGLLVVDTPRGLRLGLDRRRPRPLLVGSGRPYPSSALPDDAHRWLALPRSSIARKWRFIRLSDEFRLTSISLANAACER
jgi:hypothetical protein